MQPANSIGRELRPLDRADDLSNAERAWLGRRARRGPRPGLELSPPLWRVVTDDGSRTVTVTEVPE